jgi:phosphatidylglycerol:prolipoprotein diacylglycerol transferase
MNNVSSAGIDFTSLGLDPVALDLGVFELRWYSLAYLAGIFLGYWYLLRLIRQPGAPLARRHADDLRVHDYVACVVPIGLFTGRLANFINAELWGAPTTVPWAVRFPEVIGGVVALGPPRHPSQLYEAALEGLVLFAILAAMFWRSRARYQPGLLVGAFLFFYGVFRFGVEFIREPDSHLRGFAEATGLHMGQWLCVPMILGGLFLIMTAARRRQRVESFAGQESVA